MHVLNILWVVFGIGLMLVLNLKFKINSMVALLVAALSVGMLAGMDLMSLLHTMKAGFGNTLGELAIWICPYISRHLLSLNPLQARCRRYSRGER